MKSGKKISKFLQSEFQLVANKIENDMSHFVWNGSDSEETSWEIMNNLATCVGRLALWCYIEL